MATEYTIYLVNNSASEEVFWAFLQRPDALAAQKGVFANSSTNLAVAPKVDGQINRFIIPVQYVVGAGASNQAVGLKTRVISDFSQKTDLGQGWLATYANAPSSKGPIIERAAPPEKDKIAIEANHFNRMENEVAGWYSNMSFGIQTSSGFMGMTWSPDPGETCTLSPKLSFYVNTGSFGSNELAEWTDVNSQAATIELKDFDSRREVTVTLTETGEWNVTPGRPLSPQRKSLLDTMAESHQHIAKAHSHLIQLMGPGATGTATAHDVSSGDQDDTVASVKWDESPNTNAVTGLRGLLSRICSRICGS
jgi:hypothetical protein